MILSFHPCFVADAQIVLADRKLNAENRRLIQTAGAVILPQTCSPALFRACSNSELHVFPDYTLRFKYPGKVGQSILFEKLRIPHPVTTRWPSVEKFRRTLEAKGSSPHEMPFFLKSDKSHEGEGVFLVTDRKSLEAGLTRMEKVGSEAFISQKMIPCGGNVARAVVLHKQIMVYWKRPGKGDEAISSISRGSRVDKKWKPKLLERARAMARSISERTRINLAAFDFVFDSSHPDPQPFVLEINYYFGRRGLGGSIRYYHLLLDAIREWLEGIGLDASRVKLV